MGEKYDVNERVRGGAYVDRLNPDIVSTHINEGIGAKHLPMPMVAKTGGGRTVPEQDKRRIDRVEMHKRYKK